jgi:hypothetical protein
MQSPVVERDETLAPQCRHHWVIESPQGATSVGKCKKCEEVREFRNSAADTLWEGDPMTSAAKMAGGGSRPIVREVRRASTDE